ncbi:MAG TPA: hypothetical protein VGB19_12325 [Actinomycetota bacterium]
MPDLRTVLDERARRLDPHPMPDAFDRTLRRARRRARNRRLGAALVAFAVFAGTGTGLWLALQSRPPTHRVPTELPTPGAVSTIPLPAAPSDVAVVPDGTVWVALGDALARIDPITGEVTTEYEEAFQARTGQLTGIAVRAEGVFTDAWMSDSGGLVWHVLIPPPGFEGIARGPTPVDVGGAALGVAVGAGAVWATVAHEGSGEVVRIDERTEEVTDRYFGGVSGLLEGLGSLAVAGGTVWVQVAPGEGPAATVEPGTGRLIATTVPGIVASSGSEVWVSGDGTVRRVHPSAPALPPTTIDAPWDLAVGDGAVWVVSIPVTDRPGFVREVDRATGALIGSPVPVGLTPVAVAVGGGALWVANLNGPSITRIELECGRVPCAGPSPAPVEPTPTEPSPTPSEDGNPAIAPEDFVDPPVSYLFGQDTVGQGYPHVTLPRQALSPLTGWLSPVATYRSDTELLYSDWRVVPGPGDQAVPSIRQFDVDSGQDALFATNAVSFAVTSEGSTVAYVQLDGPSWRMDTPLRGTIMVRGPEMDAPWATGETFFVVGWAGDTLLAYRENEGEIADVLALDGPGQVRTLAEGALIVALSPDGTQVMLAGQADGSSIPMSVEVVNVADGSVAASIPSSSLVDPDSGRWARDLGYGGDWNEHGVVVASASDGLAVLRVDDRGISLVRLIPAPHWVDEPQFVVGDPSRIVYWSRVPTHGAGDGPFYELAECSIDPRFAAECERGDPGPERLRPIRTLSRPFLTGVSGSGDGGGSGGG